MEYEMKNRRLRDFGELIGDPYKYVLRNAKAFFTFNLFFLMLPFIVGMYGMASIQKILVERTVLGETMDINWVLIIFSSIALFICMIHGPLAAFSIMRANELNDGEKLEYKNIHQIFKKRYLRNLTFILTTGAVGFIIVFIFVGIVAAAPGIGIFILCLFLLVLYFYLYPILLYAYISYMDNLESSINDAFSTGKVYLDSHWGNTIGLMMATGIIVSVLSASFGTPLNIVALFLGQAVSLGESTTTLSILTVLQAIVSGVGMSFLIQVVYISFFLKYYDIEEQSLGTEQIARINQIGENEVTFFENEGEY